MPFFTVITPTFDRPDLLNRAVLSVLEQEFTEFEYLIVNNHTSAIENNWNDSRIRIIDEPSGGANRARNRGIVEAIGEFVCFLDDDDEFKSNHLKIISEIVIEQKKAVGVYRTFTEIEFPKGKYKNQPIILKPKGYSNLDHIYTTLFFMACICCHKEILKEFSFDEEISIAQDYHLWTRILCKFPLFESPEITSVYNNTSNSISSSTLINHEKYIKVYSGLFAFKDVKKQLKLSIRNERMFYYYSFILHNYLSELSIEKFHVLLINLIKVKPTFLLSVVFYKFCINFLFKQLRLIR